jgi:hypothetical protein
VSSTHPVVKQCQSEVIFSLKLLSLPYIISAASSSSSTLSHDCSNRLITPLMSALYRLQQHLKQFSSKFQEAYGSMFEKHSSTSGEMNIAIKTALSSSSSSSALSPISTSHLNNSNDEFKKDAEFESSTLQKDSSSSKAASESSTVPTSSAFLMRHEHDSKQKILDATHQFVNQTRVLFKDLGVVTMSSSTNFKPSSRVSGKKD